MNLVNKGLQFCAHHWKAAGGFILMPILVSLAFGYFVSKDPGTVSSVNGFFSGFFGALQRDWALTVLVLLIMTGILVVVVQYRQIVRYLNARKPEQYKRFEDIVDDEIRYGYVPFFPTTIEQEMDMRPKGVGIGLLDEIFHGRLKNPSKAAGWNNIFDELEKGTFDVIATPLYDVAERRKRVLFSQPIFYADIGIYTSLRNTRIVQDGPKLSVPGRFKETIKELKDIGDKLYVRGCDGELQIKMTEKYLSKSGVKVIKANSSEYTIREALEGLNDDRESDTFSDIVFCERSQAEMSPAAKSNQILNLLHPGQLLFPVAFAIRKNEDTLRKFVNLRLMTIEGTNNSGISDRLVKQTKLAIPEMDENEIRGYFRNAIDEANLPGKRQTGARDDNVVGLKQPNQKPNR